LDFLFVGNRLSLDFLNTRPVIDGAPVELLPDDAALKKWLHATGVPATPVALEPLLEFREDWRTAVLGVEAGKPASTAFLARLNALLRDRPGIDEVVRAGGSLARERRYPDAFGAIAADAADLLTAVDPNRIRKCDNCVLHFLDTSKKGTRRWCSMRLCGNRLKVAAYTSRQKNARKETA
jgi:predicted RNA-binding Zn ribbon-like protein